MHDRRIDTLLTVRITSPLGSEYILPNVRALELDQTVSFMNDQASKISTLLLVNYQQATLSVPMRLVIKVEEKEETGDWVVRWSSDVKVR